jgi:hypothetical protein
VTVCSCDPVTRFVDEDCRVHGLPPGITFPPMDRHKHEGEDARAAQRRLFLAAAPDRLRVRAAGFGWPLRACPLRELGQR